jgi:outer membrane protein assembly factor BamA
MKTVLHTIFILLGLLVISACSSTKYVPDGQYLLDKVDVVTDTKDLDPADLKQFVHQSSNSKWFSLFKTQLYIYNLSGRDSTRWANKVLRRLGDAPVLYDETEALHSQNELTRAIQNMGYIGAVVKRTTSVKKKKLTLTFHVISGSPYKLHHFSYDINDTTIMSCLNRDSAATLIHEGMLFNINVIDQERDRITTLLNNRGFYRFSKEYITYTADTVRDTHLVDLTMHLVPFPNTEKYKAAAYRQYRINKVMFITDFDMMQASPLTKGEAIDSIHYNGCTILYKDNLKIRPKVLTDNLHFASGDLYRGRAVQRTYSSFGRLSALKYSNIRFSEMENDSTRLNSFVLLTPGKNKTLSFELEGTNSAGDLGAAASVSLQHRNLFHGSELFMIKLRGAYEAISGLKGYSNNGYTEYGVETSLNFPRFMFPFISQIFKKRMIASTEFGLRYNYQLRPEFSRTVLSSSWSYKWSVQRRKQHRFDLLDISYIYLPWISDTFKENYIDKGQNYIFEYNYRNRFIFRTGYTFVYNSQGQTMINNTLSDNAYAIRFNFESAGNLLYLISKAVNLQKNSDHEYSIFNIPYAQYLKADIDYARNFLIDHRTSLAIHGAFGIAVPYGNAKTIPFEKQYFSGGANSVRGWLVRELGPGKFPGDGNYLNQSGDIKLDASIELRSKLFWKFRGAAFVDAGNIWTIRDYDNQPGGVFKFNKFYKQIAVAYGLGLRMDFGFCILRFDFGMKAVNPEYESGRNRYPIYHPDFGRDLAFHFAVGYPF